MTIPKSDDQSFSEEDIPKKIYSNPLFDEEIISMKIDLHHFNAESDLIESLLNRDNSIISSSSKIDSLFDEFSGELALFKSIPPRIDETDCDLEEETHFIKRLLYYNSSPRPSKEFVFENSNAAIESFSPSPIPVEESDSLMEEIDLSFTLDYPMPSDIKEDDYDSERDILILEELLSNNSLSLPENESFHFDIPSFSRPPAKPPDGNTRTLNVKMMVYIFEHKVPMPRLMFTQPTLIQNQEKSPDFLPHQGHENFQPSAECPVMIHGRNTPILDVPFILRNLKTHAEGFCPPSLYFLGFIRESHLDSSAHQVGQASNLPEKNMPKNVTIKLSCSYCDGPFNGGNCLSYSILGAENEFVHDPNPFPYDNTPDFYDQPPQHHVETYSCELCGNDSHYGYDCPPRFPIVYEQEPVNRGIRTSMSLIFAIIPTILVLTNPLQYSIDHQPQSIQEDLNEQRMNDVHNKCIKSHNDMIELRNELLKTMQSLGEMLHQREQAANLTMVPEDSLIMRDQNLSTILEMESDEFIKSSVEDLVLIPRESKDTFDSDKECDLPNCDNSVTFSNPLFDAIDDFTTSNEDIESKDSYISNLDEPNLLVTPLSVSNEDECFDPGDEVDEIKLLLHHDQSTPKMSVAFILEGFTNELPLEENDIYLIWNLKRMNGRRIALDYEDSRARGFHRPRHHGCHHLHTTTDTTNTVAATLSPSLPTATPLPPPPTSPPPAAATAAAAANNSRCRRHPQTAPLPWQPHQPTPVTPSPPPNRDQPPPYNNQKGVWFAGQQPK
nr:hypothetical protein [Tanacetum cinerariifolium]